jgi:hypothetical protein
MELAKADGISTLPYSSYKYRYRTNAQFGDQTRPWFSINYLDGLFARGMTPAFVIPCPDNAPDNFQEEALLTTKEKLKALRYHCVDYDRLHRSGTSVKTVSWIERFNQGKSEARKANGALPLFTSSVEELQASWRDLFNDKRRIELNKSQEEDDYESEEGDDESDEDDLF